MAMFFFACELKENGPSCRRVPLRILGIERVFLRFQVCVLKGGWPTCSFFCECKFLEISQGKKDLLLHVLLAPFKEPRGSHPFSFGVFNSLSIKWGWVVSMTWAVGVTGDG